MKALKMEKNFLQGNGRGHVNKDAIAGQLILGHLSDFFK